MKGLKECLVESVGRDLFVDMEWHSHAINVIGSILRNDRPITAFCMPPMMGATELLSKALPKYFDQVSSSDVFYFTCSDELTNEIVGNSRMFGAGLINLNGSFFAVKKNDLVIFDNPIKDMVTKKEFDVESKRIHGMLIALVKSGAKVIIKTDRTPNRDLVGYLQMHMCIDVVNFQDDSKIEERLKIGDSLYISKYMQIPTGENE